MINNFLRRNSSRLILFLRSVVLTLAKGVVSLALTDPHEFGIDHEMKNNRTPPFEKTYFVHFGAISTL